MWCIQRTHSKRVRVRAVDVTIGIDRRSKVSPQFCAHKGFERACVERVAAANVNLITVDVLAFEEVRAYRRQQAPSRLSADTERSAKRVTRTTTRWDRRSVLWWNPRLDRTSDRTLDRLAGRRCATATDSHRTGSRY